MPEQIEDGTALFVRHSGTVELWALSSKISCARSHRTRQPPAGRTGATSRRSWRGRHGPRYRTRRGSTVSCCGAIWRTWRRAGTPAGPSHERQPPSGVISPGCAAMGSSRSILPGVCRPRRRGAPAARADTVGAECSSRTGRATAHGPRCLRRSTRETMRCSSFSTAAGCESPSSAGSDWAMST